MSNIYPQFINIQPDVFTSSLSDKIPFSPKAEKFAHEADKLIKEYNQKLTELTLAMRRSELKKLNMIDVRPLLDLDMDYVDSADLHSDCILKDLDKDQAFMGPGSFFSMIPCFEKGVIWCNTNRYIYFEIKELDVENKTCAVFLRDYAGCKSGWTPGVYGTMQLFEEEKGLSFLPNFAEEHNMSNVYRELSQEQLGWNDRQMKIWTTRALKLADEADKKIASEFEFSSQFEQLSAFFLVLLARINRTLAQNKVSRPVGEKRSKRTCMVDADSPEQSKKHVRMVGKMAITSEKPPKLPSYETVVHYSTASWPTRGFVRTYKSGKQVYIKETIHHRKCMENTEGNTVATVIRFRKEKMHESK